MGLCRAPEPIYQGGLRLTPEPVMVHQPFVQIWFVKISYGIIMSLISKSTNHGTRSCRNPSRFNA